MNLFQIAEFFRFYRAATTKYQLHSPFVFELACAVLEDERWFYAFRDVEEIRQKMLKSDVVLHVEDYGSGGGSSQSAVGAGQDPLAATKKRSVRSIARRAGSSAGQGQMLFRLATHLQPHTMLELGTSVGIGAMYLASAVREARFVSLEGSSDTAHVARMNLDWLGLAKNTEVREGPFEETLTKALQDLQDLDFAFFDGNHRPEPTLHYFEECLAFAHEKTVFVFDDMHWSEGMAEAWEQIKNHSRVTLTLDFFELSLAFVDPDFREKQHFKILPARWKPWRFF
ncbi:MAG: class I SAM-dependent methyltransferase [Phycisphaerae bacterium]|nr:class I SAM-dependent methyltransferase [Saprospiraceae bacterium]